MEDQHAIRIAQIRTEIESLQTESVNAAARAVSAIIFLESALSQVSRTCDVLLRSLSEAYQNEVNDGE